MFVGSSHPELGALICDRLGVEPAPCKIAKFANGETCCDIGVSVRDTHAIIIMGSSDLVNDKIMEMLVLISGCRGGSASKITVVIPMFPYSKQSKMKKHRGAITARMLANLIVNAGADHVITVDLHASQMQGFFSKPVDNLTASPTLAWWIRQNVPDYRNAVIVSKNPGGTKRVTALADALKVNFAMIHTDRRRTKNRTIREAFPTTNKLLQHADDDFDDDSASEPSNPMAASINTFGEVEAATSPTLSSVEIDPTGQLSFAHPVPPPPASDMTSSTTSNSNIHIARVLKGHVVSEDDRAALEEAGEAPESVEKGGPEAYALGGSGAHAETDDEEIDYSTEQVIALVGDVNGRTAILLDDMIDRPESFIAAAEHCRLNCGAKDVYIIATHGVFSNDSLEMLSESPYIDHIVVTNTYPIATVVPKLHIIDISAILAECIRRNHNGESISALFEQMATI